MKEPPVFLVLGLSVGLSIGASLGMLTRPEKEICVTISEDLRQINFRSNDNHDGDKYFIVCGKDTIDRGEVIGYEWSDPKSR
jgi:hypothetical protein